MHDGNHWRHHLLAEHLSQRELQTRMQMIPQAMLQMLSTMLCLQWQCLQ